jgi:hypothetical protein
MNPVSPTVPASAGASGPEARPRRYTQGFSDGVGDRLLLFDLFDNSSAVPLELLCFKREFSESPGFESALRKRVEDLASLSHPALSSVKGVEWLEGGQGLALVSKHVAGRRLSEILQSAKGPVFALELLRQLTPGLVALQQQGFGFAHGVLTADRVIVTREGRLLIVEHALGAAMESLRLPARRLRSEIGLALPDAGEHVLLDARVDVIQLGFIALSLLLGRRLETADIRARVPVLLDEFASTAPTAAKWLRPWFERALQVAERPFETAEDAMEVITELPAQLDHEPPPERLRSPLAFRPSVEAPRPTPAKTLPFPEPQAAPEVVTLPDVMPDFPSEPTVAAKETKVETRPVPPPPPVPAREPARERRDQLSSPLLSSEPVSAGPSKNLKLVAIGLGIIATVEAGFIAVLLMNRSEPIESVNVAAAPAIVVDTAPAPEPSRPATPIPPPVPAPEPPPAPAPAEPQLSGRFGGIRVNSPVDLQVFEGGTLLGTTAGTIGVTEGTHTLDLVNESLGYKSRQTVSVKAGQMVPVRVTLPQGRININAVPWANVWIDGNAAGETPIANLSIVIGSHDIVFRHPQLGESRQTVVVKAEGITRISANLQR